MQYAPRRPPPPQARNRIPAALRAAARVAAPGSAWPGSVPWQPGSPGRGSPAPPEVPGHLRRKQRCQKRTPTAGRPPQRQPPNPGHPHRTVLPGLAGTPAAMGVLPGEGPVTGPAAPELPGVREWSRPSRRPGGTRGSDGMRRSSRMAQTGALSRSTASERTSTVAARFAGGWPFGRIIGTRRCHRRAVLAARDRSGRDRAGRPDDRPQPGGEHARPCRVSCLATGSRTAEPGDRRARLRTQRAATVPGAVPRWAGRAAAAGRQPAATAGRHAGRPGRSHHGAAAGRQLAGHLRPAHDQPGGCLRKAPAGPLSQPGQDGFRPDPRRDGRPAGQPGRAAHTSRRDAAGRGLGAARRPSS